MSAPQSRFVSAGELPPEDTDDVWKQAKDTVKAKREAEDSKSLETGKSLYETLQANKAAKEEAFAESIRLKNQIQPLNEEDVEYIHEVAKVQRAEKAAAAKQASADLAAFRSQQAEAEKAVLSAEQETADEGETWSLKRRKRKNSQEKDLLKGVKLRKTSSTDNAEPISKAVSENVKKSGEGGEGEKLKATSPVNKQAATSPSPPLVGLGLGAYSSDDDDD